jgi:hypothetical protein
VKAARVTIRHAQVADTDLTSINAIQAAPAALTPPTLNFTKDYGSMLRLILDYTTSTKDSGTWTITNPKANPPLANAQINNLIVIAHYEV